jgi:hypothetical protein
MKGMVSNQPKAFDAKVRIKVSTKCSFASVRLTHFSLLKKTFDQMFFAECTPYCHLFSQEKRLVDCLVL